MTIDSATSGAALLARTSSATKTIPKTGGNEAIQPQGRHVRDRVEISDAARGAASLRDSLSSLVSTFENFQAKFAAFGDELGNKFRAAGIDTSVPVDLRVDADGRIGVSGSHPDKDKIEALFAEDPEFANRFRGISAASGLLKAAEDHVEFAAAYQQDPEAAIEQYSHLFSNGQQPEALFRFAGTDLTASFADQSGARSLWASSRPRSEA